VENTQTGTPWYAENQSVDTTAASTERPVIQQAKEQTRQVLQQTQRKAGEIADQARTQVMSQLDSQKERATGGLGSVALALRQTGQHLREQEQVALGQYVERAAEAVERFSGSLGRRDVNEMVDEVENFARRQPALFLGSTFALGLLAARFLKSSSPPETHMMETASTGTYPGSASRAVPPGLGVTAGVSDMGMVDRTLDVTSSPTPTMASSSPTMATASDVGTTSLAGDTEEEDEAIPATGTTRRKGARS